MQRSPSDLMELKPQHKKYLTNAQASVADPMNWKKKIRMEDQIHEMKREEKFRRKE